MDHHKITSDNKIIRKIKWEKNDLYDLTEKSNRHEGQLAEPVALNLSDEKKDG